jgi:hypothetical protein
MIAFFPLNIARNTAENLREIPQVQEKMKFYLDASRRPLDCHVLVLVSRYPPFLFTSPRSYSCHRAPTMLAADPAEGVSQNNPVVPQG